MPVKAANKIRAHVNMVPPEVMDKIRATQRYLQKELAIASMLNSKGNPNKAIRRLKKAVVEAEKMWPRFEQASLF